MKTKKTKTKRQKDCGNMGYVHAYRYLENYVSTLQNKVKREMLFQVLNDFKYCIKQTEKFEEAAEAVKALKNAFSEELENLEDSYF